MRWFKRKIIKKEVIHTVIINLGTTKTFDDLILHKFSNYRIVAYKK